MKKLIIANWKCNPTTQKQAKQLLAGLNRGLKTKPRTEVVICPPFVYLQQAVNFFHRCEKIQLQLGAQDCFWQEQGAFTGEVSPQMLKDLKVKYVIVGHSERRQIIGETDEIVNKKLRAIIGAGLIPILCIGETAKERQKGQAFKVLEKELRQGLAKVPKANLEKLVVAYEPIWAIGTGTPCSPDDALTAALFIRKTIGKIANRKTGRNIKVLYGGSVNAENCTEYLSSDWLNGLLVGSVSLKPKKFLQIIKIAVK